MPRAHTGSVNHVRLCAIRPSFSHCRLSRLECLETSRGRQQTSRAGFVE